MLVLTRKLGQSVVIDHNIKVTVIGIGKQQVKLGVDASRNVIVHREEVYKRIKEENKLSSSSIMNLTSFPKPTANTPKKIQE
ncbi:MAG: carbon storage regulator CsrA [Candidatus Scalinduaceae bacterium]